MHDEGVHVVVEELGAFFKGEDAVEDRFKLALEFGQDKGCVHRRCLVRVTAHGLLLLASLRRSLG